MKLRQQGPCYALLSNKKLCYLSHIACFNALFPNERKRERKKLAVHIYCILCLIRHIFFPEKYLQKSPCVLTPYNKLLHKNAIKSIKAPFLIIRCIISLVVFHKMENMVYCTVSTVFLSSAHCCFMLC